MKRTSCALALALAGALLFLQSGGTTLAQEAIKQIALTAQQVEGFIAAQKDLAELAKKMEASKAEQPDPKAQAEVESIAKKHGFKDFADYDDVGSNIDMILAGIDADSKKFVPPQEAVQKEIAAVNADKSLSPADRGQAAGGAQRLPQDGAGDSASGQRQADRGLLRQACRRAAIAPAGGTRGLTASLAGENLSPAAHKRLGETLASLPPELPRETG